MEESNQTDSYSTFYEEVSSVSEFSCRFCLASCTEESENVSQYGEMYTSLTDFMIYNNDIPKKVCESCKTELQIAAAFFKKIKTTEEQLVQMSQNFEIEIDFIPLPDRPDLPSNVEDLKNLPRNQKLKSEEAKRPIGRPRTKVPINRGPVGRPRGSTKDRTLASGRVPGSVKEEREVKKENPTQTLLGDGLDHLRCDLPSFAGKKGRPKKYSGDGSSMMCDVCGRIFLESERKTMYNHMHKHRVEAKQKERRQEEEVLRKPGKVLVVGESTENQEVYHVHYI